MTCVYHRYFKKFGANAYVRKRVQEILLTISDYDYAYEISTGEPVMWYLNRDIKIGTVYNFPLLRKTPLFADASDVFLESLAKRMTKTFVCPGTILTSPGYQTEILQIIIRGHCQATFR